MTTVDAPASSSPSNSPITQAEINHLKGFILTVGPLLVALCAGICFIDLLAGLLTAASIGFTTVLTVGVAYAAYRADTRSAGRAR